MSQSLLLGEILTGIITFLTSLGAAWYLDKHKARKDKNNRKIETYIELLNILSSDKEKNSSHATDIEELIRNNYHILDKDFKDMLPSTLEFNAYWCVRGQPFSRFEGSPAIRSMQVNFFSIRIGMRSGWLAQGMEGFDHSTIYFWFEKDEDKDKWIRIGESALNHYNKLTASTRDIRSWKFTTLPTNAKLSIP